MYLASPFFLKRQCFFLVWRGTNSQTNTPHTQRIGEAMMGWFFNIPPVGVVCSGHLLRKQSSTGLVSGGLCRPLHNEHVLTKTLRRTAAAAAGHPISRFHPKPPHRFITPFLGLHKCTSLWWVAHRSLVHSHARVDQRFLELFYQHLLHGN